MWIRLAQRRQWPAALKLVFADLPPAVRDAHVAFLVNEAHGQRLSLDGLWVACETEGSDKLLGALWVQYSAGDSANFAPPRLARGAEPAVAAALLETAVAAERARGTELVTALLEPATESKTEPWIAAGFEPLAELIYLAALAEVFPRKQPEGSLYFAPAADEMPLLAEVVQRTYDGTLDCPALNGLRSIEAVLADYRSAGRYDPQRWLLVRKSTDAADAVGCLLLTDHPEGDQWELVYMGLVPEARGQSLGRAMVRYAQWLTGRAGRSRLVVAVDAANRPAVAMYEAEGFGRWDRRRVWRLANPGGS